MQPLLSAVQACALHCDLLQWTCHTLCGAQLADVELWVSGNEDHPEFERCSVLGVSQRCIQQGADLGERMLHAISDGLGRYRKVILVGSDCPAIDRSYLRTALQALDKEALVLGPATDGGYVLIGATRINPALFQGVSWGRDSVFEETVARANALDYQWTELNELPDIDRPEDLPMWEHIQHNRG
jgi:rSAM/selenodomain-associated transferase 1